MLYCNHYLVTKQEIFTKQFIQKQALFEIKFFHSDMKHILSVDVRFS